jgi:hypothetical protein
MDPTANMREQLRLAKEILKLADDGCDENGDSTIEQLDELGVKAQQLAELVLALNTWIMNGGFLPTSWADNFREVE